MRHATGNENKHSEPAVLMKTTHDAPMSEAVDMTVIADLEEVQMEGEPDLIVELIDLYFEDVPRQMTVMRQAIGRTDGILLKRAAHNLKGGSANLGARRMAMLCEQLELAAVNVSFQETGALLSELEREFERVQQVFVAERQVRT